MITTVIMLIVMVLILIIFIAGMVQMWTPHKPMTDQELYGMSGNAYALLQMGDEQFKHFFSEEEYREAKVELEELKRRER